MTSSNGTIFRVIGPLCGEFTGPDEFPAQRPVTRSFGVFFDLCLNKRLSKQPWGWWFETPSWSLWRQCNAEWLHSLPSTNGQVFTSVGLFACNNITENGMNGFSWNLQDMSGSIWNILGMCRVTTWIQDFFQGEFAVGIRDCISGMKRFSINFQDIPDKEQGTICNICVWQ